jgi:hypothetical protein
MENCKPMSTPINTNENFSVENGAKKLMLNPIEV